MKAKDKCIFNLGSSRDSTWIDDSYEDGHVSNDLCDIHSEWSSLDGKEVTIASVTSVKTVNGCINVAKVFLTTLGEAFWFTALTSELARIGVENRCKCDLALLITRGCQCGGN